jgi:hypothetical protein
VQARARHNGAHDLAAISLIVGSDGLIQRQVVRA